MFFKKSWRFLLSSILLFTIFPQAGWAVSDKPLILNFKAGKLAGRFKGNLTKLELTGSNSEDQALPLLSDKECIIDGEPYTPSSQEHPKLVLHSGGTVLGMGEFGKVSSAKVFIDELSFDVVRKDFFEKEGFRQKALKEYQALYRLQAHGSFPNVYSLVIQHLTCCLIQEKGGLSLAKQRKLYSGENPHALLSLGIKLSEALAYAHSKGIYHLDLKEDNILISEDLSLKIVDFGESGSSDTPHDGSIRGSSFYIAPEQFITKNAPGPASDVFSLGVILYRLKNKSLPQKVLSPGLNDDFVFYMTHEYATDWERSSESLVKDDLDYLIVHSTLHPDPAKRLTMKELSEALALLAETYP